MKAFKNLIVFLLVSLFLVMSAGCNGGEVSGKGSETHGNYTDEMKIPYSVDLSQEDGADHVEREGDHKDSPYFSRLDFYNMKSTDTLTIIPKFKTMQQTSEWSCGVVAALMVMQHYGKLGDETEESLSSYRSNGLAAEGTSLRQALDIFDKAGGFETYSTFDCADNVYEVFTFDYIISSLKANKPIMVAWNDWGGHWQVIIGYDTMGTETTQDDVIIVADPYDTTDHNQDGYGVYGAERFLYNFTMYDFFEEEELNDMLFIVATLE